MTIQSDLITWAVGLLFGVPLLAVVLSEIIARQERSNGLYVRFWRRTRDLLLPAAVAFLIVRQVLEIDTENTGVRILETAVWALIAYALGSLLNAISKAANDKGRWESIIPALFRGLLRVVVIGVPIYYILAEVWGVHLNDLLSALGVGSLVIALALQDTFSSIVSGLLLTLDRPFEVGDQILIDDRVGKIADISWRSVRVQVNSRDLIVVPNSEFAKRSVYNYTRGDITYRETVIASFSYDDSPNEVRRVLKEAAASSPYLLATPEPTVFLDSFEDSSIRYEVLFFVKEFKGSVHKREVVSDVRLRIYYAAQRAGLNMAYPIMMVGQHTSTKPDAAAVRHLIRERLQNHSIFSHLPQSAQNAFADQSRLVTFGSHEIILRAGQPSTGLYVVMSGEVEIETASAGGETGLRLSVGSVIGEMIFFGSRPNLATVQAVSDVVLIFIPPDAVNDMLRQQPRFAYTLDRLVNERQELLESYISAAKPPALDAARSNGTG